MILKNRIQTQFTDQPAFLAIILCQTNYWRNSLKLFVCNIIVIFYFASCFDHNIPIYHLMWFAYGIIILRIVPSNYQAVNQCRTYNHTATLFECDNILSDWLKMWFRICHICKIISDNAVNHNDNRKSMSNLFTLKRLLQVQIAYDFAFDYDWLLRPNCVSMWVLFWRIRRRHEFNVGVLKCFFVIFWAFIFASDAIDSNNHNL